MIGQPSERGDLEAFRERLQESSLLLVNDVSLVC